MTNQGRWTRPPDWICPICQGRRDDCDTCDCERQCNGEDCPCLCDVCYGHGYVEESSWWYAYDDSPCPECR